MTEKWLCKILFYSPEIIVDFMLIKQQNRDHMKFENVLKFA